MNGSYANVYEIGDSVYKTIRQDTPYEMSYLARDFEEEVQILRALADSPHVVNIIRADPQVPYMELELLQDGLSDLQWEYDRYAKRIPTRVVYRFMMQLLYAVRDIQRIGIYHGDLSFSNIRLRHPLDNVFCNRSAFVSRSRAPPDHARAMFFVLRDISLLRQDICIIDFGNSRARCDKVRSIRCHRSPGEFLGYSGTWNPDVWSIGTIVYMMLTGNTLISDKRNADESIIDRNLIELQVLFGRFPDDMLAKCSTARAKRAHLAWTSALIYPPMYSSSHLPSRWPRDRDIRDAPPASCISDAIRKRRSPALRALLPFFRMPDQAHTVDELIQIYSQISMT